MTNRICAYAYRFFSFTYYFMDKAWFGLAQHGYV